MVSGLPALPDYDLFRTRPRPPLAQNCSALLLTAWIIAPPDGKSRLVFSLGNYSTAMPFQKATRSLMFAAASFGSE